MIYTLTFVNGGNTSVFNISKIFYFFSGYGKLAPGATRSFMPAGLEDVEFFKDE